MVPITLPELGVPGATVSAWFVREGERVFEGDRLVEVLIPGATFDVPSPTTGTLTTRTARVNDRVAVGDILGSIDPEPDN